MKDRCHYDAIKKAAANFDFLASDYREQAKAVRGSKELASGLLYLVSEFGAPESIKNLADEMMESGLVSHRDAAKAVRVLDSIYYQEGFREQFPEGFLEFGAIKDRLAALL